MKVIGGLKGVLALGLLMFSSSVCSGQTPELVVQTGHSCSVESIAFSPDGKTLASRGLCDDAIKLWDVATGDELRTLHTSVTSSIVFSPDGRMLAYGNIFEIELWDVVNGKELPSLKGHSGSVTAVAFTPDGKTLASGSADDTIKLWDVFKRKEIRTLRGHSSSVDWLAFSPDGKTLASVSLDQTIKLWDLVSGRELRSFSGHSKFFRGATFSPDGKTLASGLDNTIRRWDIASGKELLPFRGHSNNVASVVFGPDGKTLASGGWDNTIRLWEAASGKEVHTLLGHLDGVNSVVFSPDGKTVASGSRDSTIKVWNVASGQAELTFQGHSSGPIHSVTFSSDGKMLASGSIDQKSVSLWQVANGTKLSTLHGHSNYVDSVSFSPNGRMLVSGSSEVKLWDVDSARDLGTLDNQSRWLALFSPVGNVLAVGHGNIIELWDAEKSERHTLQGHSDRVSAVAFSSDGQMLASAGGSDHSIKLWDIASGREIRNFQVDYTQISSVAISPDGNILAAGGWGTTIKLWDIHSAKELRTLDSGSWTNSLAFSPDGKILASGNVEIRLWDIASGNELRSLKGYSGDSISFSPDGSTLAAGYLNAIKLWDVATGRELCSLIGLDQHDWAVVDTQGRFDASPGAQKLMRWRIGSGLRDIVSLEQLKERYYEPGLLQKLLGFRKEALRDVSRFDSPRLYPDLKYVQPAPGQGNLSITFTNRGGGIGRVQVFVNGKEFLADARDEKLKAYPNVAKATLNIDLSKARSAITGKDNDIRIVAWNVENYISSRGTELVWNASGATDRAPPEVYAIIGGISKYDGAQLNLNFAGKDAVDMANAIELGAKRLFGADKVHLALLSTADDPRAISPTKDNFTKAFETARRAKPTDILIVYLAGHGITLQRGSDMYCYLTREARTTDTAAFSDSAVRQQQTITSEELVEWIKVIPALKQVVMLDTCAAGAAQAQLKLVDKREASGDAIRAIDRAKDRTGSYILMGSAADSVSYEASQYGQGLLTYALLKGMKGAALRNDEFVDVSKLFQFARDEVELMAKNMGGIQRPMIFSPKDDSFEVGQLNGQDKLKISLATPKPMILRPRFLDAEVGDDTLDLMKVLRARLRDESFVTDRGSNRASLLFVDDEDFPGAIRPTGTYTITGETVNVKLLLRRDGVTVANVQLSGSKLDLPNLAAKIVDAVKDAIRTL